MISLWKLSGILEQQGAPQKRAAGVNYQRALSSTLGKPDLLVQVLGQPSMEVLYILNLGSLIMSKNSLAVYAPSRLRLLCVLPGTDTTWL